MLRRERPIPDEQLDWAIRQALRAETEGLEPSPAVWQRIRAEIERPAPTARPMPRRLSVRRRAASLMQGAILTLLVLGVGLSFSQGLGRDMLMRRPTTQPSEMKSRPVDASPYPRDALNLGYLKHLEQEPEPGEWRLLP